MSVSFIAELSPVYCCLVYNVLRCVTMCSSVFQCVTMCYNVLQCVTMCYNVLQCVTIWQLAQQTMAETASNGKTKSKTTTNAKHRNPKIGYICKIVTIYNGSKKVEGHCTINRASSFSCCKLCYDRSPVLGQ